MNMKANSYKNVVGPGRFTFTGRLDRKSDKHVGIMIFACVILLILTVSTLLVLTVSSIQTNYHTDAVSPTSAEQVPHDRDLDVFNVDVDFEVDVYVDRMTRGGGEGGSNISIAFFFDPDCPCSKDAMVVFDWIEGIYNNIKLHRYDIKKDVNNYTLMIDFFEAYNVPTQNRNAAPFVFIGDYYLYFEGVSLENVSALIESYAALDMAVPLWPHWRVTWTMHVALFYDPAADMSGPLMENLQLLNTTLNRDFEHFIIHNYSLSDPANKLLLSGYFSAFNLSKFSDYIHPNELYAAVFIGDDFLLNREITYEKLNNTVTKHSGHNTPLNEIAADISGGDICIIFFYSPTCGNCHKARQILEKMKGKYPDIDVKEYNIGDPDNEILKQSYFEYYGVPESQLGTLGVFIGDAYFTDVDNLERGLEEQIQRNINGCLCPDLEPDKEIVIEKFTGFTLVAVLSAGLIDGINPCAFATLIFFIGYLAATGRTKKQILAIGLAFTLGVFFTYMVLGFGLYSLMSAFSTEMTLVSKWLYPLMGGFALLLGFASLYDLRKARKGKKDEMVLKLPKPVKSLIGRTIKHLAQLKYFIVIAVITGVLISLFEFLCTGQIYLPTIMVIWATAPEHQLQAGLLLLAYNLMFILPLVIIFASVYVGMGSDELQKTLDRNRPLFKLLTAIMFFVLGTFLIGYSLQFII